MSAESDFEAASAGIKKSGGLTMNAGGAKAEAAYGQAYQALVQSGLRPQLRRKYRGR